MLLIDRVDHRAPDGLGVDQAQLAQGGKSLLDRPQAEIVADKRMYLSSGQRCAGSQECGKHAPLYSRQQSTKGEIESHMTKLRMSKASSNSPLERVVT
ncbi:MAG: hypothetical protein VB093_00745 [Propionicimonas sp.]|nr:hypothetical protein [Propionicimonas sp.]